MSTAESSSWYNPPEFGSTNLSVGTRIGYAAKRYRPKPLKVRPEERYRPSIRRIADPIAEFSLGGLEGFTERRVVGSAAPRNSGDER